MVRFTSAVYSPRRQPHTSMPKGRSVAVLEAFSVVLLVLRVADEEQQGTVPSRTRGPPLKVRFHANVAIFVERQVRLMPPLPFPEAERLSQRDVEEPLEHLHLGGGQALG